MALINYSQRLRGFVSKDNPLRIDNVLDCAIEYLEETRWDFNEAKFEMWSSNLLPGHPEWPLLQADLVEANDTYEYALANYKHVQEAADWWGLLVGMKEVPTNNLGGL